MSENRMHFWTAAIILGSLAAGPVIAQREPQKAPPRKADPNDDEKNAQDQAERELQRALEDLRRVAQQMAAQQAQLRADLGGLRYGFGTLNREEGRLGARLEAPNAVLVDQLDLPKGQGMVLHDVKAESAAGRAGFKTNDILVELNGKAVPSDALQFAKAMDEIKAKTPVDAVVVRKGKKETVKGLTLPEPDPNANLFRGNVIRGLGGNGGIGINGVNGLPGIQILPNVGRGRNANGLTIIPGPDGGFTTRYREGDVSITVVGKQADGKTQVNEIEINDGKKNEKYKSVEDVPDEFREDVKFLIRRSEKSSASR